MARSRKYFRIVETLIKQRRMYKMTRNSGSLVCFLILSAACVGGNTVEPTASTQAHKRSNVILIMEHDLGWGDTGYNGNQTLRTPSLDEMAASGVVLERFYSAAPVY